MKAQTLKGFRDFLPKEALKRKWLREKISGVFELWGYDPLETPTLEPLELFAGQIGEDEKLFFKFKDPGGRDVALRYDQTVPASRVVGQYAQQIPMPFKRYQIQPAFRAENPQKGRYREFLQCDADIFGLETPLADAEIIALSLDIYKRIGFPQATARINDRQLLTSLPYEAIVAIDKIKKIGEDGVIKDMEKKGISTGDAKRYLTLVQDLQPNDTINTILEYLKSYGFDESWYVFDSTIARSFSYSTGPIWEIEIPGFTGGSVLGGERFDKLIETIAGVKVPGTGFGLGFDRTLEAADQFKLIPELTTSAQVLVTVFSLENSIAIAKKLREAAINTELYTDPAAKLDKQLKYADRKGIPYVVIQGSEEEKRRVVKLKNMKIKEQEDLSLDQVIQKLKAS
ncbi:histidine--tRNA ligase [Candidatus Gottesmanbacteria bacterium RIFCSPLOWO2_01_FULL_46_21]|uniref:Histidine--tRNA ligase n=1 Tax=Candidatus Gottesmanbacteria bacterium RIFCSPLOWO2_01_FULL_46_21 TaxID=1798393 RepID=A0A1F6AY82_9BACT|nr:MAG: histidine--tRNA ligase [Candidatus Gottesmanbacteria bacterium RIFCSPLOWO2_01_FULL_46_21]